ncbi:hypothetical protein LWI29_028523 [Acer saccharum]|uniref:Uncharacterized protein n=1 Tax=Acer saccharum TaxID=4024 RepID=A0AA39THQ4_ACESA|nr:hypothetical protein LWI29_028523 [Acer saccharum]
MTLATVSEPKMIKAMWVSRPMYENRVVLCGATGIGVGTRFLHRRNSIIENKYTVSQGVGRSEEDKCLTAWRVAAAKCFLSRSGLWSVWLVERCLSFAIMNFIGGHTFMPEAWASWPSGLLCVKRE